MKTNLLFTLLLLFSCKSEENSTVDQDGPHIEVHETLVTVPDDFATIQKAIDQSKWGDTIVVKPGTYTENIDFKGRNILLTSLFYLERDPAYISSTIINGSKEAVVKFMNNEGPGAILQGFTIKNGVGTVYTRPNGNITRGGGGILGLKSSPTIRYNIVEDNEAIDVSGPNPYAGGGGIRLELGSPKVHNNVIRNNKGGFGGGVFLDATSVEFTNNIIEGNQAIRTEFAGGGGLYLDFVLEGSNGNFVVNNTIVNNLSAGQGGGLVLAGLTVNNGLIFLNNVLYNNENEEVFSRFEANPEDFNPSYCLIEGGYPHGTDIISSDPKLSEMTFLLTEESPCIDAGHPDAAYQDPNDGENAIAPGRGTLRNDIGSYGGPGAFSILSAQ